MKQLVCTVAAALLLALPGAVSAQSVGFGVHGNFSIGQLPGPAVGTASQLKDAYGSGWGGGVQLDLNLVGFSFRFAGDYIGYSLDQQKFRDAYRAVFGSAANQISIDGGDLAIYAVSANAKMGILPLPVVTPYLTAGVGLAWLKVDETKTSIASVPGVTTPANTQSGKTSLNLGAGIDIKAGVTLYAEVKYVWILTSGETSSYVPITVGITF
jgi:opacity protein-like surface antigen